MTYCLAISVDSGLVFASYSRTNAGVDNVATYGKMHTFGVDGDRQIVVLTAGNLATSQGVVAQMKQDIKHDEDESLFTVTSMGEAAEYLGRVLRGQQQKHGEAVAQAGFSAEATFIIGGQIGDRSPKLYLVYPQGNFITTSLQTPFLQIGESKYGKAILDRIIRPDTGLDEAARCALVSIDSTIRSNATVGPPIELLYYRSPGCVGPDQPRPMNQQGLTHFSFRVSDLRAVCDALVAAGGRVLEESRVETGRSHIIMATDPDGTRLELIEAPGDPSRIPNPKKR